MCCVILNSFLQDYALLVLKNITRLQQQQEKHELQAEQEAVSTAANLVAQQTFNKPPNKKTSTPDESSNDNILSGVYLFKTSEIWENGTDNVKIV